MSSAEAVAAVPHSTGAMPIAIENVEHGVGEGLRFAPWKEVLPVWRSALATLPGATLYQHERWLEALRSCYGTDLRVATLHRRGKLRAAAVFAYSKRLFSPRFVSIPFSDRGEILAVDDEARADFMRALLSSNHHASIEVRGTAGSAPWVNVDCFVHWTLDLNRSFGDLYSGISRTVRNGVKRARKDGIQIERGTSIDFISRYFELQLETRRRLGIPPQPLKFFKAVHEKFSVNGDCEVWFATQAGRDLAGLVLLREGDQLCYKWGARSEGAHRGANHLLVVAMLEEYAGKARSIDFGRCDSRNEGLVRSKADLGCTSTPLPYAFFPSAPRHVSSEVLSGPAKLLSSAWKRLPLWATRLLGAAMYRYVA
jgi:Acetyltransferase (GNAT) domain